MKKFLLLFLLIPSLVYGAAGDVASIDGKAITAVATVAGKANAAILTIAGKPVSDGDGASCSTGSLLFESVASSSSSITLSATNAYGSSFKTGAAGNVYIHSIELVAVYSDGAGSLTLRYGNAADLSSYYGEKKQATVNGTNNVTFLIQDTTNVFANDTTYYFGILTGVGTYNTGREAIATDSYDDGALYNTSTGWDMTGTSGTYDLRFKVYQCAD
jgi:hypothetical protein